MILSQEDIQSADLSFEPALSKRAANRKVFLIAKGGAILEGIKSSKRKGITIPVVLAIRNRPELAGTDPSVRQPLSELSRDVLAMRIREKLNQGSPIW